MNEGNSSRHTITINGGALSGLRKFGRFGESYSEVILRMLHQIKAVKSKEGNEDG